ncbi:MAG: hypothetical protein ACLR8Y_15635 [Alistipes indistinctus]
MPASPDDHQGAVPLLHRAEKHFREGGGQDQKFAESALLAGKIIANKDDLKKAGGGTDE